MASFIDTIVVGGGQAGLSASWHLKNAKREHVVLDRGHVGDTWRDRWDSFCLVTPNHLCRLPGFPYDGDEPHGFMLRDQIVAYVERFASNFGPPLRSDVEVERVVASNGSARFRLQTSVGDFLARNLIIAVGTHQHPNIPDWDGHLAAGIERLHTRDYRNPEQLPEGAVLVVGSGQSGCQVVEDLLHAGRDVHLCVGNAGRLPRRYRGRDILDWDVLTGYMDLPVDQHPKGKAVRFQAHSHLTGRNGGHTIDLRQLALDGVRLHGKVLAAEGKVLRFAGNLVESLEAADRKFESETEAIDAFIDANDLDDPVEVVVPIDWQPAQILPAIDLAEAGISTVIYATGFHFDFGWIDLPVFNERGYPHYQRGVTELPGLYFVGLHWMQTQGSGLFAGVGRDAEYIVEHMNRQHEPQQLGSRARVGNGDQIGNISE